MSDKADILLVDDEADVRDAISEYLDRHGLNVETVSDGEEMRKYLVEKVPDLILLDLSLPGEDGLSLARWLNANKKIPVIILTATAEPLDRVIGLEIGADDYIGKPFEPRELLARIRTVLRRAKGAQALLEGAPATQIRFGRCILDLRAGKLIKDNGKEERLTGMELDLLRTFADHPNQLLTREQLLTLVRPRDASPLDRSVDVRITRIRRKIEPDPSRPNAIRTVRGVGYIFEPMTE